MKKINIRIHGKTYNVEIAQTDEEREKGLMDKKKLPKDEGMLFVFDKAEEVSMWMKDTTIPLDLIFINENLEVIAKHVGIPFTEDYMTEDNVSFVLELNIDSNVEEGDELEFLPDKKTKADKMLVLNEEGLPQMELDGGERIFSRANTKILIKFAKKAYATGRDSDYKALGKRVFKFLKVQDTNEPEHVSKKN